MVTHKSSHSSFKLKYKTRKEINLHKLAALHCRL